MKKNVLLVFTLCTLLSAKSQNLISNSAMNGFGSWNNGGCVPEMGPETDFGGSNAANNVTEIDALTCIQQDVNIGINSVYTINFVAFRRTNCDPFTANPAEIRIIVTGLPSNTVYSTTTYGYTNTTFAVTNQSLVVSTNATDNQVRIRVESINTVEGCGVGLDNFTMVFNGPLPINLVSFNAASKTNGVDLNWITNSEINSGYFIVYRSKNGVNFDEIGRVNATGFAAGSSYSFNDGLSGGGLSYYRLKLVDRTGYSKLSGIIKANLNTKNIDLAIYPTVVNDMLNYVVENPKAGRLNVIVSDVSGRRITNLSESFAAGTTQKNINVSKLAQGMYLLTVTDETTSFKKSVIFKKN